MPYFAGAGREMYFRESGHGKDALVFVHGWYQNGAQAWGALAPRFEKKYRVFVPDLPGHGLSPLGDVTNFSIAVNRSLLTEFIRHIRKTYRLRRVILVGHSYGAFAVLDIAATGPREVDAVLALAAIDDYAPYVSRLKRVLMIPRFLVGLYYRLQAIGGWFPYGDRLLLYGSTALTTGGSTLPVALIPGRLAYAKIKNRTLPPASSQAYMGAFVGARVDWPEQQLDIPLLLLYGERDALTSAAWSKKILPHFARGEVAVVAAAGHNVQISGAEAVESSALTFFEKSFRRRVDGRSGSRVRR